MTMPTDDVLLDLPQDEETVLTVGDPVEGEPVDEDVVLPFKDDDTNIAFILEQTEEGKKEGRRIVEKITKDFDGAWDASEEFRERTADNWRIFMGELPPKDGEFKFAANVHIPMSVENISRVYLRMHGELFGDFKKPFVAMPVRNDPVAMAEAEIATKHTNWQLRNQIKDFRRQTHRCVLGFLMVGDITWHSYRDPVQNINRHEVLTPDQFVTPYTYVSTMPDYSDVPFRVKILEYYAHELESMRGKWAGIDDVLKRKPSWDEEPEQKQGDAVADVSGIHKPDTEDIDAPYKCLWWEGWLRLPNREQDHFCCAVVERESKTLLKLYIHEYEDWQDAERFQRETAELAAYRQQYQMYSADMMQREQAANQAVQAYQSGQIPESFVQDGLKFAADTAPQPPPAPKWLNPQDPMAEPRPIKRKPVHHFTHIVGIEPFVGPLGIGYGRIQTDLNKAANILFSQSIDQGTFGNFPVNLVDQSLEFKDEKVLKPGAFIKVAPGASGGIKESIQQITLGQANPQLVEFVNMLWGWAQSSMQSPNVLSGESGKSGETRGGLLARIEQATKQLSVFAGKVAEGMTYVYKANSFLNYLYIEDVEVINVTTDVTEVPEEVHVSREIYAPGYDWEPTSDLRFSASEQKIMEADQAFQIVSQTLPIHQNQRLVLFALKRMFSVRGWKEMVAIMDEHEKLMAMQQQMAQQQQAQQGPPQGPPQQGPQQQPPPNGAPYQKATPGGPQ